MKHNDTLIYFKEYLTTNLEDFLDRNARFYRNNKENFFVPYEKELSSLENITKTCLILKKNSEQMLEYSSSFDMCVTILTKVFPSKEEYEEMKSVNIVLINYIKRIDSYINTIYLLGTYQDALPEYIILKNKNDAKKELHNIILKMPIVDDSQKLDENITLLLEDLDFARKIYLYEVSKYTCVRLNTSTGHSR